MIKTKKFKRLYADIETSANIVYSWRVGNKINLTPDNIIQERAVICICWKFEGDKKVSYLTWNKGDDKEMITKFAKIANTADEIVTHNGDNFDIKWIRTRCIYHGVDIIPDFHSIDTLKLSRRGFNFNSNKLNYIGQFLGVGEKLDTGGFGLWKDIMLNNSKTALDKMVKYCQQDVLLLEKVYKKLEPYVIPKTHMGVFKGKSNHSCPRCASTNSLSNGERILASGLKKLRLQCKDCGQYFSIAATKI